MCVKPIKSEADYETALKEIERLWEASPDTEDGDRLDVLVILVEAYEEKYHNIPLPDPMEAIEYHMESRGLSCVEKDMKLLKRAAKAFRIALATFAITWTSLNKQSVLRRINDTEFDK